MQQSRLSLYAFLALLGMFLVINFRMIAPYLLALFTGTVLALLSYRLFAWLQTRGVGRKTSAALTTIALLVLLIGPLTSFITLATQQGIAVAQKWAQDPKLSMGSILERVSHIPVVQSVIGNPANVERQVKSALGRTAQVATTKTLELAAAIPSLLLQLALALLTCFFLLLDGKRFLAWASEKLPLDRDIRILMIDSFRSTVVSTIWATLAAAVAQSIIILLAFAILQVPAAFLAGGATFILAWIPLVGSFPVWVTGAIYLYVKGAIGKMAVMILFGLVASVTDNFVRPLVLKGRGSMHPLVSLIAIFGGIHMFGILGVFVGPTLVAILTALLNIWPTEGRRLGLEVGAGAFPEGLTRKVPAAEPKAPPKERPSQ